jgi:glycerol-3-phosphate dehydrogenase (NAD+)
LNFFFSELRIFVLAAQTIKELEVEMLNGQMLQGPFTAEEVNYMLKAKSMEDRSVFCLIPTKKQLKSLNFARRFPLFTAVHKICIGELPAEKMVECIRQHPEHM